MYSKIILGELMDRQPGEGSGAGEEPVGDPGLPGDPIPDPTPTPTPTPTRARRRTIHQGPAGGRR